MDVVKIELYRALESINTVDSLTDSNLSKAQINKLVLQELRAMQLSIYNVLDIVERTK